MQEQKVALVTGSSSGIGFETALLLARTGIFTYASMRNKEKSSKIKEVANEEKLPLQVLQLDVNEDQSVSNAIDEIMKEKSKINVLVNNAGYGIFGSLEDLSIEEIKSQFETNFYGVIRVTQKVIPIMRKSKTGGVIVNVSSVGGLISVPFLSAYNSTKFALEGLSESLSYELEPFGIKVVIIEPGFIKTNIMNSSILAKKAMDPNSPYSSLTKKVEHYFKTMVNNTSSSTPEEVAKTILEAISSKRPQLRYLVGSDAIATIQARKGMPEDEFRDIIRKQVL
ncbi:MAG: SDR family oxidoreductase [Thermoproteota archaeon]|nr:SDR family oxidoreductase [Thermoproteota archaeon]